MPLAVEFQFVQAIAVGVFGLVFALVVFATLATCAGPWFRGYLSGVPIGVFDVLGMRFRRVNVHTVLDAMILARHAGVVVTCREMESAYLQGVDLEKTVLAMIEAKRRGTEITVGQLVEAELAGRLAQKLKE